MMSMQPRWYSNYVTHTGQSGLVNSPHDDFLVYASGSRKGSNRVGKSIRLGYHKIALMILSFKSLGLVYIWAFQSTAIK